MTARMTARSFMQATLVWDVAVDQSTHTVVGSCCSILAPKYSRVHSTTACPVVAHVGKTPFAPVSVCVCVLQTAHVNMRPI